MLLRSLGFVPLAFAASVRREERRVIDRMRDAGALNAERAITLGGDGMIARWVRRRLLDSRAIAGAGNDRYYLLENGYAAFRGRRRKRAMMAGALLLIGLFILWFRGDISL